MSVRNKNKLYLFTVRIQWANEILQYHNYVK